MQVHAPWALAVGARLTERYGLDGAAFAADDGIVLRVPMMDEDPPGAELFTFEPDELEEAVISHVSNSALFAARFRETSSRALLLPRQNPTQRTPLWQQRQRASQLLEVAANYSDFPLIVETMREVLQDVYDLPALKDLTQRLEQRRIRLVETTTSQPSPFAQSLLFGYIAQYLYEGDSLWLSAGPPRSASTPAAQRAPRPCGAAGVPRCRHHRRVPELRPAAESLPQAARRRRRRCRPPSAARPLSAEQLARRLRNPEQDDEEVHAAQEHVRTWAHELISAQRAFPVSWHGEERFAAAEDAARLRDGLGLPLPQGIQQVFLEPVDDPLGDLVSRYARSHGPFTPDAAAAALGLRSPRCSRPSTVSPSTGGSWKACSPLTAPLRSTANTAKPTCWAASGAAPGRPAICGGTSAHRRVRPLSDGMAVRRARIPAGGDGRCSRTGRRALAAGRLSRPRERLGELHPAGAGPRLHAVNAGRAAQRRRGGGHRAW